MNGGGASPAHGAATPFFTVVMNAHNGAAFIGAAIDSVLAQSFTDFELLVWDDFSTDETAAICRSYTDRRVRFVAAGRHKSLGSAREAACGEVRGEWAAFLDQDDLWEPGKLAAQHRLIAQGPDHLGLVYGRTTRFDARAERGEFDPWHRAGQQPQGDIFRKLLRYPSFVALSSACVRATALRQLGGIPAWVRYCPDYYIFLGVARDWLAACVPDLVCRYRLHDDSMSRLYKIQIHEEALRIATAAARPVDHKIVVQRKRVVNTLIATDEVRNGRVFAAIARLISGGSFRYFLGRPVLHGALRPTLRLLGRR